VAPLSICQIYWLDSTAPLAKKLLPAILLIANSVFFVGCVFVLLEGFGGLEIRFELLLVFVFVFVWHAPG
jgi:hypothetical protein